MHCSITWRSCHTRSQIHALTPHSTPSHGVRSALRLLPIHLRFARHAALDAAFRNLRNALCSHRTESPSSGSVEEYPPDIAAALHLPRSLPHIRTGLATALSAFHQSLSAPLDALRRAHLFVQAFSDSLWADLLKMVPPVASPLAPFLPICLLSPVFPAPTPQFGLLASR